ncbi:MAG: hypothetical protein ACOX1S_06565 [Anaerostipes sp.]|jgi:hypothetical protein
MEKNLSGMLVETVVKKALKRIKDSPERGIRNLVDMALQFSEGRFQTNFFAIAQTMLQNENSAYYGLVRDTVAYTDLDRLYTFGMNLGYNGCTVGAQYIRKNEEILNCNIPWTISVQIDTRKLEERWEKYDMLIGEGESLGIYTWMFLNMDEPQQVLSFVGNHSDSVFFIFCEAYDLSAAFLDEVTELYNVMLVVRYEESIVSQYAAMWERGLLFSTWYQYGQEDVEAIISGDFFCSSQQLSPMFTVLIPEEGCPKGTRQLVYEAVKQARAGQTYGTIIWELQGDNCLIDSIISSDGCSVCFDREGNLWDWDKQIKSRHHNLLQSSLSDILISAYPKDDDTLVESIKSNRTQ